MKAATHGAQVDPLFPQIGLLPLSHASWLDRPANTIA
jgi:hypothetical protein